MFLVEAISPHQLQQWIAPGQQEMPFAFDIRLNQIPEDWHQLVVRFRRANGIRDGDLRLLLW